MVIDHLGFFNNLFYPTGEAREETATPILREEKGNESDPLSFNYYTISSTMRKVLLIPLVFWYLLWQFSPLIPLHFRPAIDVETLIEYDKYLFSAAPHQQISYFHSEHLDILMAIPYSLHVAWPLIFAGWAMRKSTKLILPFGNCFGLVSFMAVVTELLFPCAPPWYYEKYGNSPASYDLKGDPGGLARLDQRFNFTWYDDTFSKSPLVFGAFPSLHVAWPVLLGLFMWHHVCSKWLHRIPVMIYVAWVCIAVVYLHHHYVVDVIGGIAYAWLSYQLLGPHCDDRLLVLGTKEQQRKAVEARTPYAAREVDVPPGSATH